MTGAEYLLKRIADLEHVVATLIDQGNEKDKQIADLEKNQKPPKKEKA